MRNAVAKRLRAEAREMTKNLPSGFLGGWQKFKNGVFWTNLRTTRYRRVYQDLKKKHKEAP